MAKNEHEPVLFEDSQGNIISNDPIWKAQQYLASQGVGVETDDSDEEFTPDDTDNGDTPEDYKSVKGADLQKLAKQRKVDTTGVKTVGELRQRLVEDDIRIAAQAEVDAANNA